jgi:hypothetical protein
MIPQAQLDIIEADDETREAVEDWHDWVEMGEESDPGDSAWVDSPRSIEEGREMSRDLRPRAGHAGRRPTGG